MVEVGAAINKTCEDAKQWIEQNRIQLESSTRKLKDLLEKILIENKAAFHSITARTKGTERYAEKIKGLLEEDIKYDYKKLADLIGIRIITRYISELRPIIELIKEEFYIIEIEYKDRELKTNQVGYRGVHCKCSLEDNRKLLAEYSAESDLIFEIQVRTLCAHAAAELNHPNYELSNPLPRKWQRRFSTLMGLLEVADANFDQLYKRLLKYRNQVVDAVTSPGAALVFNIDAASLLAAIKEIRKQIPSNISYRVENEAEEIVQELKAFGLKNLDDVINLVGYSRFTLPQIPFSSVGGLLRFAMIIRDAKKYIEKSWNHKWDIHDQLGAYSEWLGKDGLDVEQLPHK